MAEEQMKALINEYQQGIVVEILCEKYHLTKRKLMKFLKENHVEIRRKTRNQKPKSYPTILTKAEIDRVIERYLAGESYRKIAEDYPVSYQAISNYVHKSGVLKVEAGNGE